jgi:hypothetical protein
MYDFERETLRECWLDGSITNMGDYDCPEYRIREPRKALRTLYQQYEAETPLLRDEWFVEFILPRAQEALMRGLIGYGEASISDAVLGRLEDLMEGINGRAVLCDLEDLMREQGDDY